MQAFLFDLDGTLVDTELVYVAVVESLLLHQGHRISHEHAVSLVCGRAWRDIYIDLHEGFPGTYGSSAEIKALFRAEISALKNGTDIRIHSSIELLKKLSSTGPVAVVSGSSRSDIEHSLTVAGIEDHVRFYLGDEDYLRGKPDPAPYARAAEMLHLPPAACVVFEDSTAGVLSAKAAGMYVVALKRNEAPEQDLSQADEILTDLGEFQLSRL